MTAEESIYAELTEITRDLFDDDSLVLTPHLSAQDVPDWDEFNHLNLIAAVEDKFGISFATDELASTQDIGTLVALIEQKLITRAEPAQS